MLVAYLRMHRSIVPHHRSHSKVWGRRWQQKSASHRSRILERHRGDHDQHLKSTLKSWSTWWSSESRRSLLLWEDQEADYYYCILMRKRLLMASIWWFKPRITTNSSSFVSSLRSWSSPLSAMMRKQRICQPPFFLRFSTRPPGIVWVRARCCTADWRLTKSWHYIAPKKSRVRIIGNAVKTVN